MIVHGEGNLSSTLWIVGEAPGAQEHRTGKPFVGGAGQILDGILNEVGIARTACYVDNVIQWRPESNNFGTLYIDKGRKDPTPELIEAHSRIGALIKEHRPNVVVALGNEALYALTGHKGIMYWRGSVLDFDGTKVIPTVHPAMVMRQYDMRPVSVMDFQRIKEQAEFPEFPEKYTDIFVTNPTFESVMKHLKDILPGKEHLTFDIETDKPPSQIHCIGFGWSKQDAICIPMCFGETSWWSLEEEVEIVSAISDLFASKTVKFIAQNGQFDLTCIHDMWGIRIKLWMDTMIGFHCVYPELKKGLDFLTSIYTTRPYYKSMFHDEHSADTLWTYNCIDCASTFECAIKIREELKEFNTLKFYEENSHKLIYPLMDMQDRGVLIDIDRKDGIKKDLTTKQEVMQTELSEIVGHELNVSSPKQMKEYLYEEMHLPKKYNKGTKKVTANAEAIEELAQKYPNRAFERIIGIRKIRKLVSTYINAPLDANSRIRCSYMLTGTVTGRLSSRASIYDLGTNLQNIPRDPSIRSMFISDPGYNLVNADLSQAEARVVAALAGEERLISVFNEGGDIHTKNASVIFRKHPSLVSRDERQLAKKLVHASNYCIGPRKFAKEIGCAEGRAKELLNQYYANFPMIKLWHQGVQERLRRSRVLTTPLGRKRMFFGRWSQDLMREAIAYVPQSTVSDLINQGLISMYRSMPDGWQLLMQIHDSIMIQVPDYTDDVQVKKFMRYHLERPLEIERRTLVIPVDIKRGKNWGEMKEI